MAATYHLLCFDCRRYLSLGKVFWVGEDGAPLGEVRVQGVYFQPERRWRSRDEQFSRAIEGFLIRHRNHELRFVPEGVDELLETSGAGAVPVELDEILAPDESVGVNEEAELQRWRERLK
jgi:hypothetical protein